MTGMLGHPESKFKTIHVAGTNGKGSTAHLLASIMQECGYKTGLYTSPHHVDFRERIRINGQKISEQWVVDFIDRWRTHLEAIELSFFEMTVGMAFQYFAEAQVDIAVIEVGMGGRLDSTNIIRPLAAVITNIGMDHNRFLGDTLPQIAVEKAGIIKEQIPIIIGESQDEVKPVFENTARGLQAPITFADQNWQVTNHKPNGTLSLLYKQEHRFDINFPLQGTFQIKNLKTVIETIRVLQESGLEIPSAALIGGIERVKENTGLRGRWQILNTKPLTIADSGHNREGIIEVVKNLKAIRYQKLHFVLGVVNDKSLDGMLALLPREAVYYFCKADIPRGLAVDILASQARAHGLNGNTYASVAKALQAAKAQAMEDDLIFVGGSTFVVAEVLE
jgi:dihydrofolate synthase/folylpolyglutamate synthase